MGNTASKFWSKMTGKPQRNHRVQNNLKHPLLANNSRLKKNNPININPKQALSNSSRAMATGSQAMATGSQAMATGDPATAAAVPARATEVPAIETTSLAAPQLPINEIRRRMNVYCFKKSRNIVQIHQRHATTCANVLNKGFECTDKIKGPSTICTLWDINELAPNTSLTAIGIQQCMQVSDFLLYCKSINVNYITSQDYQTIDALKTQNIINKVKGNNARSNEKLIKKEELIRLINSITNIEQSKKVLIINKLNSVISGDTLSLTNYKDLCF